MISKIIWLGVMAYIYFKFLSVHISPDERGFVFRSGKPFKRLEPGKHSLIPFVDRVVKLRIGDKLKVSGHQQIEINGMKMPCGTGRAKQGEFVEIQAFNEKGFFVKPIEGWEAENPFS